MRTSVSALLLASSVLVPTVVHGQTSREGNCEKLVNYLEQYPNYDFHVTLEQAREFSRDADQRACIDAMNRINVALGYEESSAIAPSPGQVADDRQERPGYDSASLDDRDRGGAAPSVSDVMEAENDPLRDQRDFSSGQQTSMDRMREADAGATLSIQQRPPRIAVDQVPPRVTVQQTQPRVTVQQPNPQILVHQPAPQVTIDIPQPEITVRMPRPDIDVQTSRPEVTVNQPEPEVSFTQPRRPSVDFQAAEADVRYQSAGEPAVRYQQSGEPEVRYEREEAQVRINQAQGEPRVRFEQAPGNGQPGENGRTQAARQNDGSGGGMSGADLMRTTNLVGLTVYGPENESIGTISELLMGNNGSVDAVVIDVGGFLGLGEKPVAVSFDALEITGDRENRRVRTQLDRDQFNEAAEYSGEAYRRDPDALMLRGPTR